MSYIYVVECSEVECSGFNKPPHMTYYCRSLKKANRLLNDIIEVNKGFNISEVEVDGLMKSNDVVRYVDYMWDNHAQGSSNSHQPQRDILSSITIKKKQLI